MKIALINLITATVSVPRNMLSVMGLSPAKQLETDEGVMIVELSRALAEHGHQVTVYASDVFKPKHSVSTRGLSIKYLRTYLKWLFPPAIFPFTFGLLHELRRNNFDVIQTTDFLQWGTTLSAMSMVSRNTPIVVWQGLYEIKSPLWMLIHKIYDKTLGKLIQRKITRFIAKSNASISFLRRNGIPSDKIQGVVPVGVNTSIFHPMESSYFRERLGIEHDVPLILTVARLHPNKGLEYLVKAMDYVVREEPKAILIIKGDGPLKNKLENLVWKLRLEQNVKLSTSFISHEEMALLYASCDFTVLPSIIEPFGFVVLESMACKKLVIASNVGGLRDILGDEKAGILVEPRNPKILAEKIIFLIRNPLVKKRMGAEALKIAKVRYDWNEVAKLFISTYEHAQNLNADIPCARATPIHRILPVQRFRSIHKLHKREKNEPKASRSHKLRKQENFERRNQNHLENGIQQAYRDG